MAEKTLNARVITKNDTKANWDKATNFVPKKGELIVYTDERKIKIGDGSTKVPSLPYMSLGEAYLTWGGKNFNYSYGPIDAALVPELGANRFAYLPPADILVEYSRDGGVTWIDYEATDAQKTWLTIGGAANWIIGKNDTAGAATPDYKLRVIFKAGHCYTSLNKFILYVATTGSTSCKVTIDARLQSNVEAGVDTWKVFASNASIGGWSGYNVVNTSDLTFYGHSSAKTVQYGEIRFTFSHASCDASYKGLQVINIFAYGGVGWLTPSTLAKRGSMYSIDTSKNCTFPAKVTATSLAVTNGTASGFLKADGSVDTNTYVKSSALKTVATTGSYNDLTDKPTIPSVTGKEDASNKVSSWSSTVNNTHYPTEKLVKDSLDGKQDKITSTNKLAYSLLSGAPTDATTSEHGLMTAADKTKLNGVATGATKVEASTTNGKIKINGTDTSVYKLPEYVATIDEVTTEHVPYFGADTSILCDSGVAYKDLRNPEYFAGTGTAAVAARPYCFAKWNLTGSGLTELKDGATLIYKIPVAGNSSYGTCLSIDGGTTYHPVVTQTNTHVGTRYAVGTMILLVYDSAQTCSVYGTSAGVRSTTAAALTGCWRVVNDYDSGNAGDYYQKDRYTYFIPGNVTYRYQWKLTDGDTIYSINTTDNATGTKTGFFTGEFDPFAKIYYYASTTVVEAGSSKVNMPNLYWQYIADLRYSFNGITNKASGLLYGKTGVMVYLVASLQPNGKAKLYYGASGTDYAACLTTTLPTTEDGLLYIKLGTNYDYYQVLLTPHQQPILWFKDGEIRPYVGKADTNQTIKVGSTTFGVNDAVELVAGDNVTLTPNTTSKTITISTESSSGDVITFSISGINYSAVNGMTWGEWLISKYNTSSIAFSWPKTTIAAITATGGDYLYNTNYEEQTLATLIESGQIYLIE